MRGASTALEPIRVLLVESERATRQGLGLLLADDPEVELVGVCASGPEALRFLRQHPIDVVFLDVEMSGMDGFQVLREAGSERTGAIIFVSAATTHALKAFEVHALDYLLKPIDDERFTQVLARAKEHVRSERIQVLARQLVGLLGMTPGRRSPPLPGATALRATPSGAAGAQGGRPGGLPPRG
ncbi:LytR/AlgR family response regulator transcription factor [Cystobacter fuscus]